MNSSYPAEETEPEIEFTYCTAIIENIAWKICTSVGIYCELSVLQSAFFNLTTFSVADI